MRERERAGGERERERGRQRLRLAVIETDGGIGRKGGRKEREIFKNKQIKNTSVIIQPKCE